MARRKTLSEHGVAALKPKASRYAFPDPELGGHYVRVQPSGAKSYLALARTPEGKQVWTTLGSADLLTLDEARSSARSVIKTSSAGGGLMKNEPSRQGGQGSVIRARRS
jgi:hypothetical protein